MLARNIAFKLLHQIDSTELFSDTVLNSDIMETIDIRDRRLVTEIVYGALRRKYNLDHILGISSSRPWHEVESSTKTLLRMSLYQLWFMDRIPDHAVVNDAVEMAKIYIRGNTYRYLNGILRHLARTRPWEEENYARDTPKWIRVSLPRWLWKRWVARYGEAVAEEYAESLNQPPQTALRHFGGLPSDELKHSLRPSELVPNAYIKRTSLEGPALSNLNNFQFQDEASQLIPYLLGNTRGWHIWDACAAPGGKASIFCRMVGDKGRVVASDHSKKRAMYLKDVLDPELFPRALVLVADAGTSAPFNRRYDAVFADVPCSGLGTIRRNPEIKWRFRP
ncbi:MAG: transcription antitermination factor NusB, partial [Acidobacteriota bacterium]